MSEKAPLEDGLSERDAIRRTRIDLGDRGDVLLAESKRKGRRKVVRDEGESVMIRRRFRERNRRSERLAAAARIASIALLVLCRRLVARAGFLFGGGGRSSREHAGYRTVISRMQPREDREQREERAGGACDQRLLHR